MERRNEKEGLLIIKIGFVHKGFSFSSDSDSDSEV